MSALTKEQIEMLPEVVADAMAGPWFRNEENDVCIQIDGQHHAVCTDQFCYGSPAEKDANARLIALAPSLAATVIEQQAEIERLRWWLSEIDMRGKQYGPEDLADLALEGLAGKPAQGVQP